MPVLIGTSGWQYKHWRERFYPQGITQATWLEFYAQRFQTVEVNNSFYALPKPETFAAWARRTPDDFVVVVKASRYLTHIKRLKDPAEPVGRLMENARRLGGKLGPILLQLPPNLAVDAGALAETMSLFKPEEQLTVEFRHDSWYSDAVRAVLTERGAAHCLVDRNGEPVGPLWKTADWGYLRLHHGLSAPVPCYSRKDLANWARRLSDMWEPSADVYVFFNNDPEGCAVRDAIWFAEECERVGLRPTRVPELGEVKVGDL